MTTTAARQREVWFTDLDPARGREQAGRRPSVVLSVDELGTGPSGLVIVVPLTRTDRRSPLHVPIEPPEGGLRARSVALPEMVRSVAQERLVERWGSVRPETLREIARRVHVLTRPA